MFYVVTPSANEPRKRQKAKEEDEMGRGVRPTHRVRFLRPENILLVSFAYASMANERKNQQVILRAIRPTTFPRHFLSRVEKFLIASQSQELFRILN